MFASANGGPGLWGDGFGGNPCRRLWARFGFEAWLTDLGSYLIIREREERAYIVTIVVG